LVKGNERKKRGNGWKGGEFQKGTRIYAKKSNGHHRKIKYLNLRKI